MCQLRRARAACLLLRRQLIFAGRLDLRHAVHHLHKRGDGYASKVGRSPLVLRARAQGAACGGVGVRTGTVGLSFDHAVDSFSLESSSRSRLGVAAGIWSRGVILTTTSSLRVQGLLARPAQHDRRLCKSTFVDQRRKRTPNKLQPIDVGETLPGE